MFIRRFTGEELKPDASIEDLYKAQAEAKFVRELEVGVMAEAMAKAFGSGRKGKRR